VYGAVREHGGGVVDIGGALGVADDGDQAACVCSQLTQRIGSVGEEVLLEQQVLGPVSASSGNRMSSAPASRAPLMPSRIRCALPSMSPTVAFI
jgi:hypothetical protein